MGLIKGAALRSTRRVTHSAPRSSSRNATFRRGARVRASKRACAGGGCNLAENQGRPLGGRAVKGKMRGSTMYVDVYTHVGWESPRHTLRDR